MRPALFGGASVDGVEDGELGFAADQGSGEPRHAAGRPADPLGHPERAHRLASAGQMERSSRGEREAPGRSCRALGDEHLAGFGRRLQAGRDVDGVARGHRRTGLRRGRGEHFPGVHPDAHPEAESVRHGEIGVDRLEPATHRVGGPQRPGGIVLVGGRYAEGRHHGVSDELLNGPAFRLDLLTHRVEVPLHHLAQPLGIEAVGQPGGAREVGEQDGDELALRAAHGQSRLARGGRSGHPRQRSDLRRRG